MKTLTFNTNSWHYRFVTKMTNYTPTNSGSDICSYSRAFITALFYIIIQALLIAVIGYFLSHFLIGVVYSIMLGKWFFTFAGEVVALTLSFFSAAAGLISLIYLIVGIVCKAKLARTNRSDGFVKNAYRAWKGKYCVKIEFKE